MGFLLRTNISPTKKNQQKTYIFTNIYKFQCFLTSAIWPWENWISYTVTIVPSTKFNVNLFDDILLLPTPFENIFIFPKKILKFAKKNFRECFASFLCIRKKRTKNFTMQSVGWMNLRAFSSHFFNPKNLPHIFWNILKIFFPVLFKIYSKTTFQRKKLKKSFKKSDIFFSLFSSPYILL